MSPASPAVVFRYTCRTCHGTACHITQHVYEATCHNTQHVYEATCHNLQHVYEATCYITQHVYEATCPHLDPAPEQVVPRPGPRVYRLRLRARARHPLQERGVAGAEVPLQERVSAAVLQMLQGLTLMSSSAISSAECCQLQVSSYQGWCAASSTPGPDSETSARLVTPADRYLDI